MKGVPLRLELGPRDIENNQCVICRRDNGEKITVSLDELEELARTAGAVVSARVIQKRDRPDTATYIGSGRILEVKEYCVWLPEGYLRKR